MQILYGPYIVPENNRVTLYKEGIHGTGHASITQHKGQWALVYHRLIEPKTSELRETCISPIENMSRHPIVHVHQSLIMKDSK